MFGNFANFVLNSKLRFERFFLSLNENNQFRSSQFTRSFETLAISMAESRKKE
jgi:hypothetical protein